jgi:hypothetical protein
MRIMVAKQLDAPTIHMQNIYLNDLRCKKGLRRLSRNCLTVILKISSFRAFR